MNIFPLTQFGDPVLRKKAKRVKPLLVTKPGFPQFVAQMFSTMHRADGVGLAAPQIGLPLRFAVIEVGPTKSRPGRKKSERIVIINPKILSASKEKAYDWEGC
ncbi:MAG: peptide deformylase, partial [Candidatus Parcubacteria bacterium]